MANISCLNELNLSEIKNMSIFNEAYKLLSKDLIKTEIKNTKENYIYYYSLIFSNIINDNKIKNKNFIFYIVKKKAI